MCGLFDRLLWLPSVAFLCCLLQAPECLYSLLRLLLFTDSFATIVLHGFLHCLLQLPPSFMHCICLISAAFFVAFLHYIPSSASSFAGLSLLFSLPFCPLQVLPLPSTSFFVRYSLFEILLAAFCFLSYRWKSAPYQYLLLLLPCFLGTISMRVPSRRRASVSSRSGVHAGSLRLHDTVEYIVYNQMLITNEV